MEDLQIQEESGTEHSSSSGRPEPYSPEYEVTDELKHDQFLVKDETSILKLSDEKQKEELIAEKSIRATSFDKDFLSFIEKQDDGSWKCNVCEKITNNKSNLKKHVRIKHWSLLSNQIAKLYRCNHCDYITRHRSNLHYHISVKHTGTRYNCDECDYQCGRQKDVERHKLNKHTEKHLKMIPCKFCYKLINFGSMSYHMKTKHQEIKSDNSIQQLKVQSFANDISHTVKCLHTEVSVSAGQTHSVQSQYSSSPN